MVGGAVVGGGSVPVAGSKLRRRLRQITEVRVSLGLVKKECETCRHYRVDEYTRPRRGPHKTDSTECHHPGWLSGRLNISCSDKDNPPWRDWEPKDD